MKAAWIEITRAVEGLHMGLMAVGYAVSRGVTSSQTKIFFRRLKLFRYPVASTYSKVLISGWRLFTCWQWYGHRHSWRKVRNTSTRWLCLWRIIWPTCSSWLRLASLIISYGSWEFNFTWGQVFLFSQLKMNEILTMALLELMTVKYLAPAFSLKSP
jgi:hypothetical protein